MADADLAVRRRDFEAAIGESRLLLCAVLPID
jgi:hypothetical protein